MSILATFPAGVTEVTVHGLHQWDYGCDLVIAAPGFPGHPYLLEVHFACPGADEAVVRSATAINNQVTARIPDSFLEQTGPITAWVYIVNNDDYAGSTSLTVTLPIIPRTKPQPSATVPEEYSDRYTEAITQMNNLIQQTASGEITLGYATEAGHAGTADTSTKATEADHATGADYATEAGYAEQAGTAEQANKANLATKADGLTHLYLHSMLLYMEVLDRGDSSRIGELYMTLTFTDTKENPYGASAVGNWALTEGTHNWAGHFTDSETRENIPTLGYKFYSGGNIEVDTLSGLVYGKVVGVQLESSDVVQLY